MQYGVEYNRGEWFSLTHQSVDISAGWRFNEKRFLGLTSGLEFIEDAHLDGAYDTNGEVPAIPLMVKYVRYKAFRKHPRHSLYFSAAVGGKIYLDDLPCSEVRHRINPMDMLSMGLDFSIGKRVGLTCGLALIGHEIIGGTIGFNAGIRF